MGAGASGLAFADTLSAEADVDVTLVDRREAPGGHWQQAYPFVRLHTPSAFYGVNSLALGEDRIDQTGENAGFYERATGEDVREYFARVAERLTRTGRIHLLLGHEHLGGGPEGERVRDLATGKVQDIAVRQKVVDARYLEASIPATHVPPFEVAPTARVVPINDLPEITRPRAAYAVRLLRRQLIGPWRRSNRSDGRERGLLRTGDRRGCASVLCQRCGTAH
ncbi:MAG TPA: FAD/NAD(P)-binding protein, partial [Vicinamibacterales bacterium]|nr:FAD/NAD(P)-binding protein [Vicinamibacterales bacterium]